MTAYIISKSQRVHFLIVLAAFVLLGCGQESANEGSPSAIERRAKPHPQHAALQEKIAHREITLLDSPYRINQATRHEIARVLDTYAVLRDALFDGATERADEAAQAMIDAVAAVNAEELREPGRNAWLQHEELYNRTLTELQHVPLEPKRSYFAHVSEIVYCTVKSFGLGADLSHVFFCPMALQGEGAYWLGEGETVENPYFGKSMPACGDLVETLGP